MDMTWPKANGAFTFLDIPEGSHLLDVVAVDLIYPQVMPGHSGSQAAAGAAGWPIAQAWPACKARRSCCDLGLLL